MSRLLLRSYHLHQRRTFRLQRRERQRERDFIYKDFKIQQRDGNESVAKKWIWVLSVFIAIIPTHLLRQKQASPPEAEFLGTISKFRKRHKISSLLLYLLHKTRNQAFSRHSGAKMGKEMYKKRDVVVLLIKPIVFFLHSHSRPRRWILKSLIMTKGLFTWRWGTPGR